MAAAFGADHTPTTLLLSRGDNTAIAFADAWRGLYQPAMDEVRSKRRPWTKLDDLHRELVGVRERTLGELSEAVAALV